MVVRAGVHWAGRGGLHGIHLMVRAWEIHGIRAGKIVSRVVRSTSLYGAMRRAQFGRDPMPNVHGGKLYETPEQVASARDKAAKAFRTHREMFP